MSRIELEGIQTIQHSVLERERARAEEQTNLWAFKTSDSRYCKEACSTRISRALNEKEAERASEAHLCLFIQHGGLFGRVLHLFPERVFNIVARFLNEPADEHALDELIEN